MENKNYLVYQITNKINEKIYIGCHVTENVDDNYMGSGTNIKKAINEFGRENFNKIILHNFNNKEDMLEKEKELVNREFIKDENNYNIIVGGGQYLATDTMTMRDRKGDNLQVHISDPRYLSGGLVGATKGRVTVEDKDGNFLSVYIDDPRYLSGELVYILKGKFVAYDGSGKAFLINKNDIRYISGKLNHRNKGKILVKDDNGNYSHIFKNNPKYLSGELKLCWDGRNHTEESKNKISESKKGTGKGKSNSQYGTCWITNENESKKIIKGGVVPDGWRLGRKYKKEILNANNA